MVDLPPPSYRWYTGDLRTGKIYRQVELVSGSWSCPFTDTGTLDGSFPLRSGKWPTARSDSAPGKTFLAVSYVDKHGDETFIDGGPIWRSKYNPGTGVLQVAAAGLGSYFDHRKVIAVLAAGADPAAATVTYTGAQLGLIAKRLVELAQTHTGGSLPIILPTDADLGGAGTDHTRTYPGYELGWVGERLKQLSQVDDGPEIQFVPRRKAADPRYIEWVMRIGTAPTGILAQAGLPWVFDGTVPMSPLLQIGVDTDGTGIASRQWAAGEGDAEARQIVYVDNLTLVNIGWPLLEGEVASTDNVTTKTELNEFANGASSFSQRPMESWAVTVKRDASPNVGQYRAGDWATVVVNDHDYLPQGSFSMRILSVSGNDSDAVTLTMVDKLSEG